MARRIASLQILVQAALAVVAYVLLRAALNAASLGAFPVGGGEYHAVFAYSAEGRLAVAAEVFLVYVGALTVATAALLLLRFPLYWPLMAAIASYLGVRSWWGIVAWRPQSNAFHETVLALLPAIPLVIVLGARSAIWLRRRFDSVASSGVRRSLRLVQLCAILGLIAPHAWAMSGPVAAWTREMRRQQWRPGPWEAIPDHVAIMTLDPSRGVLFASAKAKTLLDQCTRPTPALITGTWTPDSQTIAQLDADLARFLAANDTGRTRPNGFVMPPLHTYYRQYGGLIRPFGERLIYINGLLEGYWTEEPHSTWRTDAVSVCGGWQAYFGLEYDPAQRRFRGFSYNPSPE